MVAEKRVLPKDVIVIGQSAGGWASIALSSVNPPQVKAIITFAAGRGGRVDGKPNNNCAPDRLVEATAGFGRTSRVPMLWFYIENDTAQRCRSACMTPSPRPAAGPSIT
jgi:dienelactone hydrolase